MTAPEQRELLAWADVNIQDYERMLKLLNEKVPSYQSDYMALMAKLQEWSG